MATPTKRRSTGRGAIAATVILALIVVAILVAISAAGGSGPDDDVATVVGVQAVQAELDGLPQDGATLGSATAPVEIVEYADLQCPFCAVASRDTVPRLITMFVRPGIAKLTIRPLTFIGPDSVRGARAAAAAAQQNAMWSFVELTYRNQGRENGGWLSDTFVHAVATGLGLDVDALDRARDGAAARAVLQSAETDAQANGITATPTFVVRGPKGVVTVRDFTDVAAFQTAVAAVR